ncbi:hypothetical protein SAMN04515675_3053 [Pseudomonas costantinii]|uniref:Uncharacterized protein n=1 Tax=Pseudomonas costantinii TaxID=168469 RepID=A0A1H5EG36_9PSED|nr:hypothetical protein SAMN04515675_3053 [Pseudomonas costantinii]
MSPYFDRSHALRGNAAWDAPRPASQCKAQALRSCDAERHGMHAHAERGNDQHDESLFGIDLRFRRRAELFQRSVDQQLPQLCHLLDRQQHRAL